jgi:Uma2 family endonuclease
MSASSPDARLKPYEPKYPDSDGKPMSDNTLQFKWIVTIKEGLEALFRDDPGVFVAGDLLWYPVLGDPKIRTGPDVLVAFGRPKGYRGSYKQWEEAGVAPHVVFEVLSPGNRKAELRRKFEFYEAYGVEEYYVYDPDRGPLLGWLRGAAGLEPIAKIDGFASPRLGVTFHPGPGKDALHIIGPDGRPFTEVLKVYIDRDAQFERAETEHRRAEAELARAEAELARAEAELARARAERERAEAERRRADEAQGRAERLAARLRELGIEED